MKIAYYPGCEAKIVATEAHESCQKILPKLGIELLELENAGCCGSMELRLDGYDSMLALNGRILALAEGLGAYKLLTLCNTCALNLQTAADLYNKDEKARSQLNGILSQYGRSYRGTMEVITLPWLLLRMVGFHSMRQAVVKPLGSLKIAAFYGCHMMRPGQLSGYEHPMKPSSIDVLIRELLDGTTVNFPGKSSCCGFHTLLTEEKTSLSMVGYLIRNAAAAGADCITTPCAQCQTILDTYQQRALKEGGEAGREIPVLHLAQIVGLTMGIPKGDLGFDRHLVNPLPLLQAKDF